MMRLTNQYQATFPLESHWRQATCKEVECASYMLGWVTRVIVGSDLDDYIKEVSKVRKYKLVREGELNAYYFEAGQQCFYGEAGNHRIKLDRGAWLTKNSVNRHPLFLERNAMEAERWKDEFNEESYRAGR